MNKLIALFFSLSILLGISCTDDTASNGDKPPQSSNDITKNADGTVHVKASNIAPFMGLWSYSLGKSNDINREKDYVGRWIEFSKDQTFKSGRWQEQNNSGTFTYDGDNQILSLDYKNNEEDRDIDWGIKLGGDVMIWLGNANANNNGDQIRMKLAQERPSKPVGQ